MMHAMIASGKPAQLGTRNAELRTSDPFSWVSRAPFFQAGGNRIIECTNYGNGTDWSAPGYKFFRLQEKTGTLPAALNEYRKVNTNENVAATSGTLETDCGSGGHVVWTSPKYAPLSTMTLRATLTHTCIGWAEPAEQVSGARAQTHTPTAQAHAGLHLHYSPTKTKNLLATSCSVWNMPASW